MDFLTFVKKRNKTMWDVLDHIQSPNELGTHTYPINYFIQQQTIVYRPPNFQFAGIGEICGKLEILKNLGIS